MTLNILVPNPKQKSSPSSYQFDEKPRLSLLGVYSRNGKILIEHS